MVFPLPTARQLPPASPGKEIESIFWKGNKRFRSGVKLHRALCPHQPPPLRASGGKRYQPRGAPRVADHQSRGEQARRLGARLLQGGKMYTKLKETDKIHSSPLRTVGAPTSLWLKSPSQGLTLPTSLGVHHS